MAATQSPPQCLWARPNGKKQLLNSPPMPHQRGLSLSERISPQSDGTPLPGSMTMPSPNSADAGGWTTETAQSCMDHPHFKQVILAWIHTHAIATSGPARRRGLWRAHRLVCLDKGGGHSTHSDWHDLVQTPEPLAFATGQVRLGSISQRQAIWNWHPPGGFGNDHCP